MIVLGLDPSFTGFGWCVHDSEAIGPERVVARGRFATSSKQVFVARYMELRSSIDDLIVKYPQIEAVGIESPAFGEYWSEGMYALFVYTNEVTYTRRKDVVHFDPGTVKMLAKGDPKARKGKMFKQDMVQVARADTGIKGPFNHNEADAYLVAKFTARFWLLLRGVLSEGDLTPSEHQAFSKVHTFKKGKRVGETVRLGAIFKEGKRFYRFSLLEFFNESCKVDC